MIRSNLVRAAGLSVALGLALAACGGGSPGPSSGGQSSSAASAAPSTAASMAESMAPGSAEPSAAAINLGNAADVVSTLSSYQLDITVTSGTDTQTMTVVATKDPAATQWTVNGDQPFSMISIQGQGVWLEQGGSWVPVPGGADAYMSLFDAMAPDALISAYSLGTYGNDLQDQGSEDHNGVSSTHYHLDAGTAATLGAAGFPDDGTLDIWVANDGGYLVGMAFSGTDPSSGEHNDVQIEVSHVNDPSISIEAPV